MANLLLPTTLAVVATWFGDMAAKANDWMRKNTEKFLEFLLRSINLKQPELFKKLESVFPLTLKRDPEFKQVAPLLTQMLELVGKVNLGVEPVREQSLMSMLQGMLG